MSAVRTRYLITGGAGFIGSNFIRHLLGRDDQCRITNLDAMTYAGVQATVDELHEDSRHTFVQGNICNAELVNDLVSDHDVIVHFAAESHVDRSITRPAPFLETNFVGTGVLLEAALIQGIDTFLHISTDEVYGSVPEGYAREDRPLRPTSPYSSSKASSDLLALSYHSTYGLDVIVSRCTNNYGPYQFPEKMIPLFVTNLLDGERVPLYGSGENERDWLYVEDHCSALSLLLEKGEPGEIYNIGANAQMRNIDLTRMILRALGRDESWIEEVPDRPGHDFRYAVDSSKVRKLGWFPTHDFDVQLEETIEWYEKNETWWRPLKEARA